jgi:hypothetical protein
MKSAYFLKGACWLLLFAPAVPAVAGDYFAHGYLEGGVGRVGYHMTAGLHFSWADVPRGCEAYHFDSWEFQGNLPPGLTASATKPEIEGTPRQPGIWNVPVILRRVTCDNTGETYGDRQINFHFNIDP